MGNRVVVLVIDGHDMEVLEISTNNAARELKRDLRFVFGTYYPGLRFSVKTNVSGYRPCLEVEWTDGPTYQEVERVAGKFIGLTEEGQPVICQNLFLPCYLDSTLIASSTTFTTKLPLIILKKLPFFCTHKKWAKLNVHSSLGSFPE